MKLKIIWVAAIAIATGAIAWFVGKTMEQTRLKALNTGLIIKKP